MVFLAEIHKNKIQTDLIWSKPKKDMVPYVINMYFIFFEIGFFQVFEFLIAQIRLTTKLNRIFSKIKNLVACLLHELSFVAIEMSLLCCLNAALASWVFYRRIKRHFLQIECKSDVSKSILSSYEYLETIHVNS